MIDKLDVVRKLLAKSEGAATPEEAEAYADKAIALMAAHGIDAAELKSPEDKITHVTVDIDGSYSEQKADMLHGIAVGFNGRTLWYKEGRRVTRVTVVAYTSDMERINLLYTSLLLQANAGVMATTPPVREVAKYRRRWMAGFATRVTQRVAQIKRTVTQERGSGAELVLVERGELVQNEVNRMFPATGPLKLTRFRGDGYGAGWKAADQADLGLSRVGGKRAIG